MMIKTAALLLAGSFFFAFGRVKKDVTIGGVDVGGMTYAEAENAIRMQFYDNLPPVIVHTPTGDVSFKEEFTVTDGIARLVKRAKRGQTLDDALISAGKRVYYTTCARATRGRRRTPNCPSPQRDFAIRGRFWASRATMRSCFRTSRAFYGTGVR